MSEFSELELCARQRACQHVALMLSTPDKLEKVSGMKKNADRKKASVEAMLKTAMQSQLDGVRTGLLQLKTSLEDIKEIRDAVEDLEGNLESLPKLVESLNAVKQETIQHSQLGTATDNLKHLFTVPESVRQTEIMMEQGQLLEAHQALAELENSRDDLLLDLHKFSRLSPHDKETLDEYFAPVNTLSTKMEKHIKSVMRKTLNAVRQDPKVIVTALRIVEREERLDAEAAQQEKSATGFVALGRPKRWKEKVLDVLAKNVNERIEGNLLDETSEKMWLVRHLECIRIFTLEDLRVVKTLCQPVFPPKYEIMDFYINKYNESIKNRILEIKDQGLKDNEYLTILEWIIQTYPGPTMMGHPRLDIPPEKVPKILTPEVLADLEAKYLENMKDEYKLWMSNTMKLEEEDWKRDKEPDPDEFGCFRTYAPTNIFSMIYAKLEMTEQISAALTSKVIHNSMVEVAEFGEKYRQSVQKFSKENFEDRANLSYFTWYMVAIVNNCSIFGEQAMDMKAKWGDRASSVTEILKDVEQVLNVFKKLKEESLQILLDEAFMDIEVFFSEILSPEWMGSTTSVDKIVATLDDYFKDYKYLQARNLERIIVMARDRVATKYLSMVLHPNTSILNIRRQRFDTPADRENAADKIRHEAAQLKRFFRETGEDCGSGGESGGLGDLEFDSPFIAIAGLTDVLKADKEMLMLDIGTFARDYPDVSETQLLAILTVRGDLSKSEAKDLVPSELSAANRGEPKTKSIFSMVSVSGASSSLLQSDSGGSGVRGAMERAVEKTKEAAATHAAKNLNPFGDF